MPKDLLASGRRKIADLETLLPKLAWWQVLKRADIEFQIARLKLSDAKLEALVKERDEQQIIEEA